jgi:YfiH family protein
MPKIAIMIKKIYEHTSLLHFEHFLAFEEITHFSTTREQGFSQAPYSGLNMGPTTDDNADCLAQNYQAVARAMAIASDALFFTRQVHGANVVQVDSPEQATPQADALITQQPGICICVQTADCLPILLYDTKNSAIAAIHSGWRGTVQHILVRTLEAMKKAYGTSPSDVVAGIGPGISQDVYEVGAEVVKAVQEAFPYTWQQLIKPGISEDKAMLDLWHANHQLLAASGVRTNQIAMAKLCTFSNPRQFFSARRDGKKTGRMASGIMLR